jgi:hypothetical protein
VALSGSTAHDGHPWSSSIIQGSSREIFDDEKSKGLAHSLILISASITSAYDSLPSIEIVVPISWPISPHL